jgi:hypothetical protein
MPDYNNGKIYKLVCDTTGDVYIGSTVMQLCRRLSGHVGNTKDKYRQCASRDIILRKNYKIILIENYPCANKEELQRKEREYIEKIDCVNKSIPQQTLYEWRDKNKDKVISINKKYLDKNKDKLRERRKIYYEANKDKICDKAKQYYEANKDKICDKAKQYYEKKTKNQL